MSERLRDLQKNAHKMSDLDVLLQETGIKLKLHSKIMSERTRDKYSKDPEYGRAMAEFEDVMDDLNYMRKKRRGGL